MINFELLSYIRGEITKGKSVESIKTSLRLAGGWDEADLQEAFNALTPSTVPLNSSVPTKVPIESSPSLDPAAISDFKQTFQANQSEYSSTPVIHPHHAKFKKILLTISVIVLLFLVGGGAYAYYSGAFLSLPELVSESIDGIRTATTATYDTTIDVDVSGMKGITDSMSRFLSGSTVANKFSFTTKGQYDISNTDNIKNSVAISFDGGALSFGVELRALDGTLYGQITKAPVLAFLPTLSQYQNKWVSFPYKSKNGTIVNNPLTSISGISPSVMDKITSDQKDHLYKMIRDAHFVKMVERLSPETITGEVSYHFTFDLDRAGITSYLQSLKTYVNTIGKDDSYLSAFDPTTLNKDLDKLKDFKGEIWIGRNDKLLRKIIISFGVKPDEAKDEEVKVNMVSIFSNWNEPISIVAPAGSVPYETFISDVTSGAMAEAHEKGDEAAVKGIMSNLRATGELFYSEHKNTYLGFCSSQESKDARSAIENHNSVGFVCKDKSTAWAAGAKFAQDPNYWCVDSTGMSKQTTTLPVTTSCP